jgi:hypothetical protein
MFSINPVNYNQDKIATKDYESYKILNYDKAFICDNDTDLGPYRSVILDATDNTVVCVAPPKSVTFERFKEIAVNVNITEIIEGTMINLFYNQRLASWEIASKSAVGGNYWYFRTEYDGGKQMTFRDMFIDALGAAPGSQLNDIAILNELPKSKIYSFVLQHPNNHIVLKIFRPELYLVAVYEQMPIDAEGDIKMRIIPLSEVRNYDFNKCVNNVIHFPREIDFNECVNSAIQIPGETRKFDYTLEFYDNVFYVGYMLTDMDSGLRTAVLNPKYAEIKEIRGNHPNLQYQYFALFQTGKLNEFLWYFPNYHNLFYKFHLQSMDFIQKVHDAYVSYHIQKRGKQVRIEKAIFHHIYKLHHEKYLPSIQNGGEPVIITRKVVADYFNAMEPKEKLYHVNYKLRREPENNQ